MGVFDRQIATALRLIAKNGQTCVWQQITPSGGTAAKPGAGTVVPYTVKIAFFPLGIERVGTFETMMKDMADVPEGYVVGFMGQVPFVPDQKDTVLRGAEVIGIADHNGIEKFDPNGEGAILYVVRFVR